MKKRFWFRFWMVRTALRFSIEIYEWRNEWIIESITRAVYRYSPIFYSPPNLWSWILLFYCNCTSLTHLDVKMWRFLELILMRVLIVRSNNSPVHESKTVSLDFRMKIARSVIDGVLPGTNLPDQKVTWHWNYNNNVANGAAWQRNIGKKKGDIKGPC